MGAMCDPPIACVDARTRQRRQGRAGAVRRTRSRGLRHSRRRSRATSLIEVLAAMASGLLVLAAMIALFASNSAARAEIDRASQQMENGRFALELLRDDIHVAGFYGGYVPSALQRTDACVPRAGVVLSPATLGWNTTEAPLPIHGYSSGTVPAAETCFTNQKANTDVLVLRSVDADAITVTAAASDSNATDHYLQLSACADPAIDATGRPYIVATGGEGAEARFTLHDADCTTAARVRKLVVHAWYVSRCSVCSGGVDTVPTLRTIELTGSTTTNSALVEGIESFRLEYAIDRDGDGVAEVLSRCRVGVDECSASDWQNVIGVQVHLLARSLTPTPGHVDRKTYAMGLAGTLPPFGDGYRRHRYSTMVSAYNRIGPRER